MTIINVQCAWCHKNMGTKEFKEHDAANRFTVSHSICSSCYARVMNDLISRQAKRRHPLGKQPLYKTSESIST